MSYKLLRVQYIAQTVTSEEATDQSKSEQRTDRLRNDEVAQVSRTIAQAHGPIGDLPRPPPRPGYQRTRVHYILTP